MPMQVRRTVTPNNPPAAGSLAEGQLSVGMADDPPTLWAGVPTTVDPAGRVQLIPGDALLKSGGTMTGSLILDGPATDPSGAVTLDQMQASILPALQAGGRNVLHNPWFQINQRGTLAPNAGWPCDRWGFTISGGDTSTAGQTPIGDGGRVQIGNEQARTALWINAVGAASAGSITILAQRIEDVARLAGRTMTLSFFAAGPVGSRIAVNLSQNFGTGGTPSPQVSNIGSQLFTATSTAWTRYEQTMNVPTTIGKTLGTNGDSYTQLNFWFSADAANPNSAGIGPQTALISLWGAQLEVGDEATPLEPTDPQQDLAKCQRYYLIMDAYIEQAGGTAGGTLGYALTYPTPMRVGGVPTVVVASNVNTGAIQFEPGINRIRVWAVINAANPRIFITFQVYAEL